MEKRSFSSLISQIAEIYKDIKYYKYQAHISLQQSKMGEYRKHQAHIMYQKRKLYSLSQRVKDRESIRMQTIFLSILLQPLSK